MTPKKIITTLVLTLILVGGFVVGVFLIQQRQDIEEQAAVPGGDAEVSILPSSGSFDPGDSFPVSIYFNTANKAVSGVAVGLEYAFTGSTPEIRASDIEINPTLMSTGDWTCSTQDISEVASSVFIDISCGIFAANGFSTNADTLLATFTLNIERTPQINPTQIRFDSTKSKITELSTLQDILLIPQGSATYTVGSVTVLTPTPTTAAVATATPTLVPSLTPSPSASPSATLTPTATPTSIPTSATTTTATPTLTDAGVSLPTLLGLGLAVLVIFGSLALAL